MRQHFSFILTKQIGHNLLKCRCYFFYSKLVARCGASQVHLRAFFCTVFCIKSVCSHMYSIWNSFSVMMVLITKDYRCLNFVCTQYGWCTFLGHTAQLERMKVGTTYLIFMHNLHTTELAICNSSVVKVMWLEEKGGS